MVKQNSGKDLCDKNAFGRRLVAAFLAGTLCLGLTACGDSESRVKDTAKINIEPYSKIEFNTQKVQCGDIQSSLTLELKPDGYSSEIYSIEQSDYMIQEVKVKEGDRVKKDDVLIQFKATEIDKMIKEYTEQKELDSLLIDHYTKLAQIDPNSDYSVDIESAKEDMELADTYIKEQNERMKEYQVIAKKDGTVTYVNQELQYGYAPPGDTLVTVESGSSDYVAETEDPYEFKIGDIYDAQFHDATFSLKLTKCEKYVSQSTGADMQKLIFSPVTKMTGVTEGDVLTMIIEKPVVKNVVYVNKKSVFEGSDEKKYVYVVNEDGYRKAVEVQPGDTVDDYIIIKSGLSEGEQVVVN